MVVMKKYEKEKLDRILKIFTLKVRILPDQFKALLQSTD